MKDTYAHTLKCWPKFYRAIKRGEKTFEIRKEDHKRRFAEGDILHLREFAPCPRCHGTGREQLDAWDAAACGCNETKSPRGKYTDSETLEYHVSYIMRGPQFGLEKGWVIMSLQPVEIK